MTLRGRVVLTDCVAERGSFCFVQGGADPSTAVPFSAPFLSSAADVREFSEALVRQVRARVGFGLHALLDNEPLRVELPELHMTVIDEILP